MGKKKKNKKVKTLKDLSMSSKKLLTQDEFKNTFDKLLAENRDLKLRLFKVKDMDVVIEQNKRLLIENVELKAKLDEHMADTEEYEALLQINIDYKEHIIKQRTKINDLTQKLNEAKNALLHRSES